MVDISRTALLLMDFHEVIVAAHGPEGEAAALAATGALRAARAVSMPIFHIAPHYRPGYPELGRRPMFDQVKANHLFAEQDPADGIVASLRPSDIEPVCAKSRYSPFRSNDLMQMLHLRKIETLALAGIATSGVVLSAVRDGWDADFSLIVLADACADPDPDVHAMLIGTLLPAQADMWTVQKFRENVAAS